MTRTSAAAGKAARTEFEKLQAEKSRAIDKRNEALRAQQAAYETSATIMTEAARSQRQKELQKFQIDVERFIEVAQGAGFKLAEIKELMNGVDSPSGLGAPMRELSTRKLDEVEALLQRTLAMKGWLEVAQACGCADPAECTLFAAPGDGGADREPVLAVVQVEGGDCRRPPRSR